MMAHPCRSRACPSVDNPDRSTAHIGEEQMEIVKGPTFRVHVDAPPERVYSYVADFTRHPEWSPDEMKIEAVTPGPTRVGSTYKAEGTLQGKRNRSELQVTALTPSSRIAFTATDKSGPLFHTFTFTSQDGGTLVERKDRKSTRLNSSHVAISYAVFCLKKKTLTAATSPAS